MNGGSQIGRFWLVAMRSQAGKVNSHGRASGFDPESREVDMNA